MATESDIRPCCSSNQENEDPFITTMTMVDRETHRNKRKTHKPTKRKRKSEEVTGHVNEAFRELREVLPGLHPTQPLSRVEILRMAANYIAYLHSALEQRMGDRSVFKR
ncbi:hypothetical protein CAPTEDRAFT_227428 [Capitella teleta]|uniref:BHLH domain-containing protein n=1 Tax=Capitella teleta TaxID=283909 RepID=R7TZG2_CAPTE|nr:hypothetical protein CAPTEDRAFT_227428 [Capitella teleta]|eukprot:ELT99032.1 hypothetical protein CAPTEDRAFT_227428 [Capitella teleta]